MGVSTDGVICYGVYVEEDLPFDQEKHDDEEEWWRHHKGYKRPFEMFTEDGQWIGGEEWPEEKCDEYFEHQREWDEANPMPFELVNVCSADCPMWVIAVPTMKTTACRGYPVVIDQGTLSTRGFSEEIERFREFLKEAFDITEEPKWFLGSYWG